MEEAEGVRGRREKKPACPHRLEGTREGGGAGVPAALPARGSPAPAAPAARCPRPAPAAARPGISVRRAGRGRASRPGGHPFRHQVADTTLPPALPRGRFRACPDRRHRSPGAGGPGGAGRVRRAAAPPLAAARPGPPRRPSPRTAQRSAPHRRPGGLRAPGCLPARPAAAAALTRAAAASPSRLRSGFLRATRARRAAASTMPAALPRRWCGVRGAAAPARPSPAAAGSRRRCGFRVPARGRARRGRASLRRRGGGETRPGPACAVPPAGGPVPAVGQGRLSGVFRPGGGTASAQAL